MINIKLIAPRCAKASAVWHKVQSWQRNPLVLDPMIHTRIMSALHTRTHKIWRKSQPWWWYNYLVLRDKNLVLWQTGTAAIALCPICMELLVWFDLRKEAVTLNLTNEVLDYFEMFVWPNIENYQSAIIVTGRCAIAGERPDRNLRPEVCNAVLADANEQILMAAAKLISEFPSEVKPAQGK